ncbi:MAG: YidB family protein [Pseudomonadota bacterium]
MGFLDEMGKQLGGALGGAMGGQGGQPNILQLVQALMSQNGGLDGLLAKLKQGGLDQAVQSWLGNGQNLSVNADQITKALGNPQLAAVAKQFGIDPQQVANLVATQLPQIVDKLSPGGALQGNPQDLLAQGASLLKGFLKS